MDDGKTGDLYQKLRKLWKDAYPLETKQTAEKKMNEWWKQNKCSRKIVLQQIQTLTLKIKARGSAILLSFGKGKPSVTDEVTVSCDDPVVEATENEIQVVNDDFHVMENNVSSDCDVSNVVAPPTQGPVQLKLKEQLLQIDSELVILLNARDSGLSLSVDQTNRLKTLRKSKEDLTKKLKRLQSLQNASKKHRMKVKETVNRLRESNPEAAKDLQVVLPQTVGKPRLERDQPDLMETIIKIVTHHSSADERRRTETLRSVKTLDQLLKELKILGHNISRSGLYVRLLPRNCSTIEGKRHVNTVPVKLIRPQNDLRKNHSDTHFAAATIKFLKNLATLFGQEAVCLISQDDKARVPLGITAANKQGPILMKMDYRVRLPDHDFVIASKHKLIPSVYAALKIEDDAVSYSGPTYIAIRSGKHDKSTAPRHADDLYRLLQLDEWKDFGLIKTHEETSAENDISQRQFKPIMILLVDGGPDEGPRYPKTLKFAAVNFKRCNFDALFVGTHAPGQSASNPVERRMAPLSKDLCGVILPHDVYGTHLNKSGKTVNMELEKKNFKKCGELLADLWSERVIDKFPVIAEYVWPDKNTRSKMKKTNNSDESTITDASTAVSDYEVSFEGNREEDESFEFLTEQWKYQHVRQSQYLLQIVKCNKASRCKPLRTNIYDIFKQQFLPAPIPIIRTSSGPKIGNLDATNSHFLDLTSRIACGTLLSRPLNCFDTHCPSSQGKIKHKDYTCDTCNNFFVTKSALISHKKVHQVVYGVFDDNEINIEDEVDMDQEEDEDIAIIEDLDNWFIPTFEQT